MFRFRGVWDKVNLITLKTNYLLATIFNHHHLTGRWKWRTYSLTTVLRCGSRLTCTWTKRKASAATATATSTTTWPNPTVCWPTTLTSSVSAGWWRVFWTSLTLCQLKTCAKSFRKRNATFFLPRRILASNWSTATSSRWISKLFFFFFFFLSTPPSFLEFVLTFHGHRPGSTCNALRLFWFLFLVFN